MMPQKIMCLIHDIKFGFNHEQVQVQESGSFIFDYCCNFFNQLFYLVDELLLYQNITLFYFLQNFQIDSGFFQFLERKSELIDIIFFSIGSLGFTKI